MEEKIINEKEEKLYKKEKSSIFKTIGNIIFWTIMAAFAVCAVVCLINYKKIENNETPSGYTKEITYSKDDKTVTVYNYYVYKIVKVASDERTTVSLKLWFLKDVK